jgi:hypothetical protein
MLHEVLCGSRIEFEQRKCLFIKCYMKFCVEVEYSSSEGNVYVNVTWSFVWYKVGESCSSKGNVYLNVTWSFVWK